ncbi:MAG: hypothetical protein K2L07_04305 [Lachnospiraceae bacterium]|nr:hypothetical protein [Lachnospiraceae bacterium]
MKKITRNGFIMQRKSDKYYQGIDGDNWYLNIESSNMYFESYFDDNIDISWNDARFLDCCNDIIYINSYIKESKSLGIEFRILLCETEKEFPVMKAVDLMKEKFIGYDYAYSGGSYYSCILNDIVSKRIPEFHFLKLNEFGLFNTYEEIEQFINLRNSLKSKYNGFTFEEGDFVIFKISEMI